MDVKMLQVNKMLSTYSTERILFKKSNEEKENRVVTSASFSPLGEDDCECFAFCVYDEFIGSLEGHLHNFIGQLFLLA
jgi:hypothetical protein